MSLTDGEGSAFGWSSAGTVGFKGTKKGTPFAAQVAAQNVARRAMDAGMRRVDVFVQGPGSGRETAIRALQTAGMEIGYDSRRYSHPAQRLSPPQAPARVTLTR